MTPYYILENAANAATNDWLLNTNDKNFTAMKTACDNLNEFIRINGKNTVKLSESRLNGIMDRSVFGTIDRNRAK